MFNNEYSVIVLIHLTGEISNFILLFLKTVTNVNVKLCHLASFSRVASPYFCKASEKKQMFNELINNKIQNAK